MRPVDRTAAAPSGARPAAVDVDLRALGRSGPVHFVGIAGAGMSALAELVLRAGGTVTGCDARPGAVGEHLREAGATVLQGHDPAHVADAVAVVTTAAIPHDHPELRAARERGIPVLKRAAALGALVNRGTVVAVAGTHGKTTTTAMTAAVLEEAGLDPTGFVGGRVAAWGGGLRSGADRLFVVEADEYDRSFHLLRPDVAVVTTVEPDHLDVYGTPEAVTEAFEIFLEAVAADGLVVLCADDPGAARLADAAAGRRVLRYGTGADASLRAVDVQPHGRAMHFRLEEEGVELGEMAVGAPGLHNVRNALAAFAAARHLGVALPAARRALGAFTGVDRRFQELGEAGGVAVVDDYAHHPTEVRVTLEAARRVHPRRRLVVAFQPHLYSRTRDFAEDFGRALAAADRVWVTDVYPAREEPIPGVTGERVADAARAAGADVRYHPDVGSLPQALTATLTPGDLLVCMGAGDIDQAARGVLERLRAGGGRSDDGEEIPR